MAGYWPSPWPGEDAGPRRSQAPHGVKGLQIVEGERLEVTSRDAFAVTMVILREPGEVYLLRHTLGANMFNDAVVGWVERIDPQTLDVVERSPTWPRARSGRVDWPHTPTARCTPCSVVGVTGWHRIVR